MALIHETIVVWRKIINFIQIEKPRSWVHFTRQMPAHGTFGQALTCLPKGLNS
jgi:hypothetical protein